MACKNQKSAKKKASSISLYEKEEIRDQLDAFALHFMKKISRAHDVSLADLLQTYKSMIEPPKNKPIPKGEEIELEYIVIDDAEYLYHVKTRAVYSFADDPQHLGWFDPETESLRFAKV